MMDAAVHECMSSNDVMDLKMAFSEMLANISGPRRSDTEDRLELLYSMLERCKITSSMQSELLLIATSLANRDNAVAGKVLAKLCNEHWDEHKDWLIGVKRLLSALPK
jgi:hypothetical protein